MLFHEIYGSYFETVSRILTEAGASGVTEKRMLAIVSENAFSESTLVIPEKLKLGEWPLLKDCGPDASGQKKYGSVLSDMPGRPLTLLEKQWLKAILHDPRVRLFFYRKEDEKKLEDLESLLSNVQPLYEQGTFDYFDRYADGDDYEDETYTSHFRMLLQAIHERRLVFLKYKGNRGHTRERLYYPFEIEYSSKDDKFRVLCRSLQGSLSTINVSRIKACRIARPAEPEDMGFPVRRKTFVDLCLTDERNALQRAMLHFSDLQKETERVDDLHYRIRLHYYRDDETEIVIRILAFGPLIRVEAPDRFINLIKERVEKQKRLCGL